MRVWVILDGNTLHPFIEIRISVQNSVSIAFLWMNVTNIILVLYDLMGESLFIEARKLNLEHDVSVAMNLQTR